MNFYHNVCFKYCSQNGDFLIRPSYSDPEKPYTLTLYMQGVKNIPIRSTSEDNFALGKTPKNAEQVKVLYTVLTKLLNNHLIIKSFLLSISIDLYFASKLTTSVFFKNLFSRPPVF